MKNLKKSLAKNRAIGAMRLEHCAANFLTGDRNVPRTKIGKTPVELFLGKQIVTCQAWFFQKMLNESDTNLPRVRSFTVGQQVLVKNYMGEEKCLSGVIHEVLSPVTYVVEVNGNCLKGHVNQMLSVKGNANPMQLTQMDSFVMGLVGTLMSWTHQCGQGFVWTTSSGNTSIEITTASCGKKHLSTWETDVHLKDWTCDCRMQM